MESRVLSFTYYASSGEHLQREAEPLKLVYKDKAWYIYAFCRYRLEKRLFRVSRMKKITLTKEQFCRKIGTDDPVFPKSAVMGQVMEIELHFPDEMAYRIYDIFDDQDITKLKSGYKVTAAVPETQWLYEFIMSFGDKVDIVSPRQLSENIIKRCANALQHHRKEL